MRSGVRSDWGHWASACAAALVLCACTDDDVTLGSQCPSGSSGRATLAEGAAPSPVYGTSCAPCDVDDIQLDAKGCPVLVTWASCGGDICVGGQLLPMPQLDAGPDGGLDASIADASTDASAPDASAPDASADGGPDDDAGEATP
jgi:hypothetical protein